MRVSRLLWWLTALVAAVSIAHVVLWMTFRTVHASRGAAQVQHMMEAGIIEPKRDFLDSQSNPSPLQHRAAAAGTEIAPGSLVSTAYSGPMPPVVRVQGEGDGSLRGLAPDEPHVTEPAAPVLSLQAPLLLAQPSRKDVLVYTRSLERAARSLDEEAASWVRVRCPRRLLLPSWMAVSSSLAQSTEELLYWTAPGLPHLRVATWSASQDRWQTCLHCQPADISAIYSRASIDSFDLFVDEEKKQVILLASLLWSECAWPTLVLACTTNGLDFVYLSRTELYCDPLLPHSVSVSPINESVVMLARQGAGQAFRAGRLRASLGDGKVDIDWGTQLPGTNCFDASLWCVGPFCYVFFAEDSRPGLYARLFHFADRPFDEWFSMLTQVASFEMILPSEWFELLQLETSTGDVSAGALAWPTITADSSMQQVVVTYTAGGGTAVVQAPLSVVLEEVTPALRSATWCAQAQVLLLISSPTCMWLRKSRLPLPRDCFVGLEGESRCEGKEAVPLVTGTGRSGTSFVAKILQELGFSVAHDSAESCPDRSCSGLDAAVSWIHLFAETTECQVPSWSYHADCFSTVVHLVREPLASIQSRAFGRPLTQEIQTWIGCFVDTSGTGVPAAALFGREGFSLFALRSWILWNSFADVVRSELFLLEELVTSFAHVLRLATALFGEERAAVVTQERWKRLSYSAANTHIFDLGVPLTWADFFEMDEMATSMALQLALRFGYQYTNHTREGVRLGAAEEGDRILQPFRDGVRLQLGGTISCWETFDPLSSCAFLPPKGLWGCEIAKISCS